MVSFATSSMLLLHFYSPSLSAIIPQWLLAWVLGRNLSQICICDEKPFLFVGLSVRLMGTPGPISVQLRGSDFLFSASRSIDDSNLAISPLSPLLYPCCRFSMRAKLWTKTLAYPY
ncbi:uncharacterized protein BCR38DRAFT_426536 [Pseudomassariella vexata]|uniref:Secreted protein n=1 Tax=Pseudomassariella vexata TaxID=1141098 RepID=A0A1Y2E7H0_9PEZI|nr:uncharacterized protein BCR38DRAFT_426536 [Pseudomassariella vexata]ORY67274.1 hypothetical protein BCR38DRAFT_426536 [Pseudomassariella vexata]